MSKSLAYVPSGLEIVLFIVLSALVGVLGFHPEDAIFALILYIVIVLSLRDTFFSRGIGKGLGDIRKNRRELVLIVIVGILLFLWTSSFESIFFFSVFLAFLLYKWDSRVLAAAALIALATCPIFLSFGYDADAENMAVYAYYFLVITVILQIVEYRRTPTPTSFNPEHTNILENVGMSEKWVRGSNFVVDLRPHPIRTAGIIDLRPKNKQQ